MEQSVANLDVLIHFVVCSPASTAPARSLEESEPDDVPEKSELVGSGDDSEEPHAESSNTREKRISAIIFLLFIFRSYKDGVIIFTVFSKSQWLRVMWHVASDMLFC